MEQFPELYYQSHGNMNNSITTTMPSHVEYENDNQGILCSLLDIIYLTSVLAGKRLKLNVCYAFSQDTMAFKIIILCFTMLSMLDACGSALHYSLAQSEQHLVINWNKIKQVQDIMNSSCIQRGKIHGISIFSTKSPLHSIKLL